MIELVSNFILGGITGFYPPNPVGEASALVSIANPRYYLIPVSTIIGGLVAGLLIFRFAPEAEGHGTDAAIDAFHNKNGVIRKRVPIIKTIASAFTIGTGGSAGREGPTAQIAAGFGSILGDVFKLSAKDRRIALAVWNRSWNRLYLQISIWRSNTLRRDTLQRPRYGSGRADSWLHRYAHRLRDICFFHRIHTYLGLYLRIHFYSPSKSHRLRHSWCLVRGIRSSIHILVLRYEVVSGSDYRFQITQNQ